MRKAAVISALAFCSAAHASTMSDYTTEARWVDARGITQFRGECTGHFGTVGVSGPMAIDLQCPSLPDANVILYNGSRATINGKPAHASYPVKDTVTITTREGELTFVLPDCTKDAC